MLSSADVARRLMLIAKRDKWQFAVKTWRYVHLIAAAFSLFWLVRYLKKLGLFLNTPRTSYSDAKKE